MKTLPKQQAYSKCLEHIKNLSYEDMQQVLDALYMGYCAYNFKAFVPEPDDIDAIAEDMEGFDE